jgi:hypothetical protein
MVDMITMHVALDVAWQGALGTVLVMEGFRKEFELA